MYKLKTAAFDMFLNIFATLVPMATLQLVVLPIVARSMAADAYGIALASIALLGLIPLTVGNVINNVRLLLDADYQAEGLQGDFSLITIVSCAICAIATCIGSYIVGTTSAMNLCVVGGSSVLMLEREYLVVEYRLRLNYRRILFSNLWQAFGQFLGLGVFLVSNIWGFVYMFGYLMSDLYIIRTTSIWKEPLVKTTRLKTTLGDIASLGFANILNKLTNYADRLVLIPLAGASSVTIYYVACLFGKVLSLIISPINNVLLSYLVKEDSASHKSFWVAIVSGFVLCIIGFTVTMIISRFIIALLYPQYVDAAMLYVPAATAAAYVMVLSNVANPFVMRFCDLRWQTVMNAAFCTSFFIGVFAGYHIGGLSGFCIGVLTANCIRLLLVITIYFSNTNRQL